MRTTTNGWCGCCSCSAASARPAHRLANDRSAAAPALQHAGVARKPESHGETRRRQKPTESDGSSAYYGRQRFLDCLRQYEYWDDLIEACRSGYIELASLPEEQGEVHVNLGVAYYAAET